MLTAISFLVLISRAPERQDHHRTYVWPVVGAEPVPAVVPGGGRHPAEARKVEGQAQSAQETGLGQGNDREGA